jgi:hypothetical protein
MQGFHRPERPGRGPGFGSDFPALGDPAVGICRSMSGFLPPRVRRRYERATSFYGRRRSRPPPAPVCARSTSSSSGTWTSCSGFGHACSSVLIAAREALRPATIERFLHDPDRPRHQPLQRFGNGRLARPAPEPTTRRRASWSEAVSTKCLIELSEPLRKASTTILGSRGSTCVCA